MATSRHNVRLDVRLQPEHKQLIEEAAELLGQSLSAFTVATLVDEARDVIQRFGQLRLSSRDRDRFLAALDNPPEPNEKLRKAAEKDAGRAIS